MEKITWVAWDKDCGKEIDRAANGMMVEAAAKIYSRKTGCTVIVGYEINEAKQ